MNNKRQSNERKTWNTQQWPNLSVLQGWSGEGKRQIPI